MSPTAWKEGLLSRLNIKLDIENPRIEVPHDASQAHIIERLILHDKIIQLANSIVEFGGLMPGERIIVYKQKNQYIVLEGNRRVTACQLLLNPKLIPVKYKRSIKSAPPLVKEALKKIKVDIAPAREDSESVITKRHTEVGIIKWNTSAKMRRASRLLDAGYDLEQIAEKLGASKANIRKAIREYRLFRYVIDIGGWSDSELDILTDQTLKTNPYTRFFTLTGVKERLGLSFDENDHVVTTLDVSLFNQYMRHIARSFLIPIPGSPKPKPSANTRSTPDEVFAVFEPVAGGNESRPLYPKSASNTSTPQSAQQSERLSTGTAGRSRPKAAKASVFFENLVCSIGDERCIALTNEITKVDVTNMPIAASMLLRGIFESSLEYQIRSRKKYRDLCEYIKANNDGIAKTPYVACCVK